MADRRIGFNLDFKANTKDVEASVNKLKQSLKKLQDIRLADFKGSNDQLEEMQNKAQAIEIALTKAFNPTLNTVNIKAFQSQIEKTAGSVDQIYASFSKAGAQGQVAFHQMATEVLTTNLQLKQTHSLIDSMGKTMMNTVKWGIASSIMNSFTQSVQGAFSYVQSLQKSLTNIRIVTGDNVQEMARFADQANRAARELGRSTLDYTKSSLTFYQQGLDDETVQARTEATLKAQNITGTGAQMADYLTSVWNGYKVANEQAQLYVDKLAAVADSSASDMSQLAIAMSKVSATANVLGVDVDQLAASIATVVATTRLAPESVGTAFKTIFARINDIRTGSDQAEISLGNYSGKMASLGINVLDATGHLRDTGEVMDEIGQKWATMTREQQIYLAQTMGGQRQITQVTALFDNWATYSELLNTSLQSQGTLNEKNARYMESLGAKMEQLEAAGERVKAALIDEDDIKGLVTALTQVTNLFGNFIESIGGGSTALLAFAGLATQVFQNTIARQLNNVITNYQTKANNEAIKAADIEKTRLLGKSQGYNEGVITHLVQNKKAIQQYYDIMNEGEINAYNDIMKTVAAAQQEKIAIEKTVQSAESLKKSFQKNPELAERLKENLLETASELGNAAEQIGSKISDVWTKSSQIKDDPSGFFQAITDAYNQLAQEFRGTDSFQGLKTFDKFKQALAQPQTPQNLIHLKDTWVAFINELKNTSNDVAILDKLNGELDISKARLEAAEMQAKDFRNQIEQLASVRSFVQLTSGITQSIAGLKSLTNITKIWKNENISAGEKVLQIFSNLTMALPMLINGMSKVQKGYSLAGKAIKIFSVGGKQAVQEIYEQAFAQAVLNNATGEAALKDAEAAVANKVYGMSVKETTMALLGQLAVYAPYIIAIGAVAAVVYGLYKAWNAEADAAAKANKIATDAKKSYEQLKNSADELKSSLDQLHEAQSNLDDLTKGTQQWKDALQEVNNQVLDLIAKYPELAQYVENTNGRLSLNEQGEAEYLAKVNEGVQNARNASQTAASQARNADTRAAAAAIGHEVIKTGEGASNYGEATPWVSADQVLKVTEGLDKAIQDGIKESGWIDAIVEQTGMDRELVSAILNQKEEVLQLRNQLQQNKTADQLLYQTIAQDKLQNSNTYNNLDKLGKAVADKFASTSLKQNEDLIQRQLRSKYGSINRLAGAGDEEVQNLLKDLNEVQGTNWGLASNAVQGNSINRTFHFIDENGQEKIKTAEQIAQLIATTKALQGLGTSATDTANLLKELDSNFEENESSSIKNFLAGQGFQDLTQKEFLDITGNKDNIIEKLNQFYQNNKKSFEQLGYQSAESFIDAYFEGIESDYKKFDIFTSKLNQNLRDMVPKNLSLKATENISNALSVAFQHGGQKGASILNNIMATLQPKDLEVFSNTLGSIDWTQNGAFENFTQSLKEQGVVLEENSEEWAAFEIFLENIGIKSLNATSSIDRLRSSLSSLKEIQNLKSGDVLSDEEYQKLIQNNAALKDFFTIAIDGYMFIGNQEDVLKELNNDVDNTIEHFQKLREQGAKIAEDKSLQNNLSNVNLEDRENDNFGQAISLDALREMSRNQNFVSALEQQGLDIQSFNNSIDEIQKVKNYHTKTLNAQQKAAYDDALRIAQEYVSSVSQLSSDYENGLFDDKNLQSLIASSATSLQELRDFVAEQKISLEDYDKFRESFINKEIERLNITRQQYDATYSEISKILAENSESFRDLSDIEKDIEIDQLTVKAYEFKESLEDLGKISEESFQTMREAINSGIDDLDSIQEFSNLKEILSNLFDVQISDDEIRENFDLIQQLAQGNIGVLDQLQTKLSQDYIAKIAAQVDSPAVDSAVLELQNLIDLHPLEDLELGVSLDDAGYTEALQNLIIATGMSAEEANELLGRIGFEPEVTEQEIPFNEIHQGGTEGNYTYSYTLPDDMGGGQRVINITQDQYAQAAANGSITIPVIHGKKSKFTGGSKFGNFSSSPKSGSSGSGKGKGGGGGKGSQPKTPKKAAGVTTKTDPYRTVNNALKRTGSDLEKVRKEQDKLAGKDLLDNLTKQQKILDQQVELQKEKLAIAKQERDTIASTINQQLAGTGMQLQFDQNGTIQNMQQVMQAAARKANDEIARYNRMSAEQQEKDANKNIAKNAETWFKNIQTLLSNYDKLTEDTIPDLEKTIADQLAKQLELNLEKFNLQIDLTLDAGQASRQYNEFKKQVIDKIADDDILDIDRYLQEDIKLYQAENQALDKHIEEIRERISNMQNGLFDSVYGNNINQAFEDLAKYTDKAVDNLKDIEDKIKDIRESVFDAIDKVEQAFDEQKEEYDYISDLIDHSRKLTEIRYGDDAYDLMEQLYERERENNNSLLEFQYGQTQLWYQKMLEARQNMNNATDEQDRKHWEKQFKEYEKLYIDSQNELNSKFEESIENIIDKYVNAINKVFDELEKRMTNGLGLGYLADEWDLINEGTDRYLDKVDALYEIDTLDNAYQEAIKNAEGNPQAQKSLNELMNTQLKYLRDKDKLTKYDVDRANALLDIEVKRLALENSRNNKSKLRLRRDSQGNYTYQYTADDSDVNKAEQDLAKARKDLYDMTRDSYKDNLEDFQSTLTQMENDIKDVMADATLSEEQRWKKAKMLAQNYAPQIKDILSNLEVTKGFLPNDMVDSLSASLHEAIQLSDDDAETLLHTIVPQMTSTLADAAKYVRDQGIEGLVNDMFEGYNLASEQLRKEMEQAEHYVNQDLSELIKQTDAAILVAKDLLENNARLIADNQDFINRVNQQIAQGVQEAMAATNTSLADTTLSALDAATAFDRLNASLQAAIMTLDPDYYNINTNKASSRDVNNVNKSVYDTLNSGMEIASGATGMYTGTWGSEGRLAILHEKELLLNKDDTKNMLSAINIVRAMDDLLNNIDFNNKILNSSIAIGSGTNQSSAVDQKIHIEANFPNVSMRGEIEKAFEGLVNQAYQYAFNTKK